MSNSRAVHQIATEEASFLKSEIESGIPARAKRALQTLCRIYRNGGRLLPRDVTGLENAIIGALCSGRADEKVRRWSLSAISQFGKEQACWLAVINAINNHSDEPQVVSSAIAALFKLNRVKAADHILKTDAVPAEILTLSALQTIELNTTSLPSISIDVENAPATTLKLALVLVGLDRCPAQIFHPRFSNRKMVKVLGSHHEPLVSQYSAWAVSENPHLAAKDLGIDVRNISDQPENVRAYVYRLYSAENAYSVLGYDLLLQSKQDESEEARLGCAMGLRDTYYNGIEDVTNEWFFSEPSDEVRSYILDHIVRQSDKSDVYYRRAKEIFADSAADGVLRMRMQASAARTKLHKEFLAILHEEDDGLFSTERKMIVTNNSFNNFGSIQGQVSQSGDATNSGTQTNQAVVGAEEKARATLSEAKDLIGALSLEHSLKQEITDAISEAYDAPTASKVDRVIDGLKKAEEAVGSVAGIGASLGLLAAQLGGIFL